MPSSSREVKLTLSVVFGQHFMNCMLRVVSPAKFLKLVTGQSILTNESVKGRMLVHRPCGRGSTIARLFEKLTGGH